MNNQPKSQSIIVMILLTFVTLGIYIPIYFLILKHSTDKLNQQKKSDGTLVYFLLVTSIIEIIFFFIGIIYPIFDKLSDYFYYGNVVLILFASFEFRSILSEYYQLNGKNSAFSGLWTFLFTIYYLQYKINQNNKILITPLENQSSQ